MLDFYRSDAAAKAKLDGQWGIVAATPQFCSLLGRDAGDIIGHSFCEFTAEERNWFVTLQAAHPLDADCALTQDIRIVKPAGDIFAVRAKIRLDADLAGRPLPAEISLMEHHDLFGLHSGQVTQLGLLDRMLSAVDVAYWVARISDSKVLYVSPAYERIWGASREQLQIDGSRWLEQVHPDDRAGVVAEVCRQRDATQAFALEYRIIRPDGSMRWIRDKGVPASTMLSNVGVDVYVGSLQDITERKHYEIELARLKAEENIGIMAAELAHNFNNLLGIVDLSARQIEREDPSGTHAERLALISSAAARGSAITKLLLGLTSRQDLKPTRIDINSVVRDMKPLIYAAMGESHRVIYALSSMPCWVHIDLTGLDQALLNLIKNSREAMAGAGELLIQTRVLTMPTKSGQADATRQCVQISIEDTGTGMSEHVLRHAADPYFTTKPGGSGFGLAITDGFVKQSGGRLTFANRVGGGLMARMVFPRASP